jgi:prolyl-tRNA editing enzyme YbaK/EbsC (Cys-tRNA(Pro) deacylase)
MATTHDPLQVVRQRLAAHGIADTIVAFEAGTHTARDAAQAVGCDVAQIAKSIVFDLGGTPLIVVAAGNHRIDKQLIATTVGTTVHSVGADYVLGHLGLAVGGVTPLAVTDDVPCLLDITLAKFDWIWLSAGTPSHVLQLRPDDLLMLTRGRWIRVTETTTNH